MTAPCEHDLFGRSTQTRDTSFEPRVAADAIATCLDHGDTDSVEAYLGVVEAPDAAEVLAHLDQPHRSVALTLLDPGRRALAFSHFPLPLQTELVASFHRSELMGLIERLAADDRTDLFKALPPDQRERLLPALHHAQREDLRRLSEHPEGTAGAMMTSQYVTLPEEVTAPQAIALLRAAAPNAETIYDAYVVDEAGRLRGLVTLRALITAENHVTVGDLMATRPVVARTDDTDARVFHLVVRYGLSALPVVDTSERLVGVITTDDAMSAAQDRTTTNFHKIGTIGKLGTNIQEAGAFLLVRKRMGWLLALVAASLLSASVLAQHRELLAANLALFVFLPVLIDAGGNAGTQSATLVIRGLATGELVVRDWARMFARECLVSGALGFLMGLALSLFSLARGSLVVAIVVSTTMLTIVLVGGLLGLSLPFVLTRMRLDPATASAPLITSIVDVVGVVIYFAMATALLPLLAPLEGGALPWN